MATLLACGGGKSETTAIQAEGHSAVADARAPGPASTPTARYSTNFDLSENPISEGEKWFNHGRNWTNVKTANGLAYGTNGSANSYDDSYAYLSGFPPNQQGRAVVIRSPRLSGDPHEVELLLRWADSPGHARGYECLVNHHGTVQVVRWNGAFGDFTVIGNGSLGRGLVSGDVVRANVVGDLIKVYINGVLVAKVTDSVWTTGQPGIGFFRRTQGASSDLAFTSYTATSLP